MIKKPRPEDFSEERIKKAVFSEALQHPSTLFSAALSILGGMYMAVINPSKASLAVTFGSGVFSLISFVFNYFFRADKLAENYSKNLLKRRVKYKIEQADNTKKKCKDSDFDEGLNAYNELFEAYSRLKNFLDKKLMEKKSFIISKFMMLAEDSFYGGVSLIDKAAELHRAIENMQEDKLERELRAWERELRLNKRTNERELKLLKVKIDNHNKRLNLLKEKKSALTEITDQVEVLESTLDSTYLEVLDILESDSLLSQDKLVSNLQKAVESARKVEDRLRTNKTEENQYLRQ